MRGVLRCGLLGAAAVLLLTGCTTAGQWTTRHRTAVTLGAANYRVVAAGVAGEAEAGYVFGATVGGATAALLRVHGARDLYRHALSDLWARLEAQEGALAGRRYALVNVHDDVNAMNLFGLYTVARVAVRADVIEFDEIAPPRLASPSPVIAAVPAAEAAPSAPPLSAPPPIDEPTVGSGAGSGAALEAPSALRGRAVLPINQGGYTWIVGTAADIDAASSMARYYREQGFRSDVLTGVTEGAVPRRIYRVAVGHFRTLDAAQTARAELPADVPSDAWILRLH